MTSPESHLVPISRRALLGTGLAGVALVPLGIAERASAAAAQPASATHFAAQEATPAPQPVATEYVPMFRGNPARTGVLPGPALVGQPTVRWRLKLNSDVDSTPAVAEGVAYVVSGPDDHGGGTLYAVATDSGTELWRFPTDTGALSGSPAVIDGVVYVGGDGLYAVDAMTGLQRWRFESGVIVFSSPVVVDGIVYIGSGDGNVYAVVAATGTEAWRFAATKFPNSANPIYGDAVRSSPAIVDGVVYVGCDDGILYALDADTGQEHWHATTNNSAYFQTSAPAVVDGTVYIGSAQGQLFAVDAVTGVERWRFQVDSDNLVHSSPAVGGGVVFVGSMGGSLYALDAVTGARLWQFKAVDLPDVGIHASPVLVEDLVYIGSQDGDLHSVHAKTGTEVWKFHTDQEIGWSSVAVVDGALYLGSSDTYLYALIDSSGLASPTT